MKSAIVKLLYALILYLDSVPYIACTHFEMRYNKTNRDWRYRSLLEIVSPLSASHYLYIIMPLPPCNVAEQEAQIVSVLFIWLSVIYHETFLILTQYLEKY